MKITPGQKSTALLIAATLFGILVAFLTQAEKLPDWGRFSKTLLSLVHATIMAIWTSAWLVFWAGALRGKGGRLLAVLVPIAGGAAAEIAQLWWPGHVCDWLGFGANLLGVTLVLIAAGRRSVARGTAPCGAGQADVLTS